MLPVSTGGLSKVAPLPTSGVVNPLSTGGAVVGAGGGVPAEVTSDAAVGASKVSENEAKLAYVTETDKIIDVDGNLFGVAIDDRLTPTLQRDLQRMLDIGMPAAMFLAPRGTVF